jgi:hypothetical protein
MVREEDTKLSRESGLEHKNAPTLVHEVLK